MSHSQFCISHHIESALHNYRENIQLFCAVYVEVTRKRYTMSESLSAEDMKFIRESGIKVQTGKTTVDDTVSDKDRYIAS